MRGRPPFAASPRTSLPRTLQAGDLQFRIEAESRSALPASLSSNRTSSSRLDANAAARPPNAVRETAAARLAELGPVEKGAPVIVDGSPLADGALFRFAGENIEAVVHATRALLRDACDALGEDPWSRKW